MRPEIKWGLISGFAICAWIALKNWLGLEAKLGAAAGLLSNLIPLVALFFLLRARRAEIYDGRLSLGAGIGAGMLASLIAALIVYSFQTVYLRFINPVWIEQMLELRVAHQRAAGMTEADIQEGIRATRIAYSPGGLILTVVVSQTLMGGIFSLGLTLLLRQLPHRPR